MAGANCPIVRRSNGLLNYQDGLVYSEAMALPSLKSAVQNFAVLGIGTSLLKMGMLDFLRKRGMVPAAGAGPTLKQARRASYEYVIVATGDDGSRSETTWRGNGDPSAIATTIFLMETALGLLAKRGSSESGVLTRVQARMWLRCAGWCVEDSELDQMLDTASLPRGKTRAGTPVERTKWGLRQLIEVLEAERRSGRRNPGVPDLQAALRRLAGDRPKISHQLLTELTLEAEGLTEADLSQVLHALGLDDSKHINVDVLAQRLVSKMVQPPSAMELHELVNSKNWVKRAR